MTPQTTKYHIHALVRHFRRHRCVAEWVYLPVVDSTQQWARAHFHELPHPSLVVANAQTAGRGRHGRPWWSPPDVGIYMTWVLHESQLPIAGVFWNFAATAAVYGVLRPVHGELVCKWPNDLWARGRKLAGVLVELVYTKGRPGGLLIGIGLNVHPWPSTPNSSAGVIWLDALRPGWDRTALLRAIVHALRRAETYWSSGQWVAYLQRWFRTAQWAPGRPIVARWQGQWVEGTIERVETDGSLWIRIAQTAHPLRLDVHTILGFPNVSTSTACALEPQ